MVERLLAVQAQDARGARLTVRARSDGLRASDVDDDDALNSGELVTTWVNRGTLHLIRSKDYPWLHALTTPQLAASSATRLRQEGVSPEQADRGVRVVQAELGAGPRSRLRLKATHRRVAFQEAASASELTSAADQTRTDLIELVEAGSRRPQR